MQPVGSPFPEFDGGRANPLRVVASRSSEALGGRTVGAGQVELEVLVIVPLIAARLARGPELEFRFLFLSRLGIVMSGCEEDSAVRMNPGTGRLSGAGRNTASVFAPPPSKSPRLSDPGAPSRPPPS